jgi:hypothetical protein
MMLATGTVYLLLAVSLVVRSQVAARAVARVAGAAGSVVTAA